MHPWAELFLKRCRTEEVSGTPSVSELRVDTSLITAQVEGEQASISVPPIAPGIWAAVDQGSPNLAQELEHTWDEPLVPKEVVRVGAPEHVAALVAAAAEAIDADPQLLLRWRGAFPAMADGDPWRGAPLPPLPAPARRPPESVPKRFGSSGIRVGDEDLVESLVRVYRAFSA